MGDQFIALFEGRSQEADEHRHFGLVVDDRSAVRDRARQAGATLLGSGTLDFLDPWGNRIQVVQYRDIQFTKTAAALRRLGVERGKSQDALAELKEKGIAAGHGAPGRT